MGDYGFTREELRILKGLRTPRGIQRFLDEEVSYNVEKDGETCRSPRRVLRDRLAHCAEGALFAAAALRVNGYPPLIIDLVAVRDDDHLVAVYRQKGLWGAIAQSNYSGLGFRPAVYRTLRELAMGFFADYFNHSKEYTLRSYAGPIDLSVLDRVQWMTTEKDLYIVSDYLTKLRHERLIPARMRLPDLRSREYAAGCVGRVVK